MFLSNNAQGNILPSTPPLKLTEKPFEVTVDVDSEVLYAWTVQ